MAASEEHQNTKATCTVLLVPAPRRGRVFQIEGTREKRVYMEREKRRDEKTESRRRRTTTKRWSTTVYVRDRVAEKCGKRSEEERERKKERERERERERVALPQARRREGGRRGGEPPDRVVSFIKKFFITLCERMCYSTEEDLPRPA